MRTSFLVLAISLLVAVFMFGVGPCQKEKEDQVDIQEVESYVTDETFGQDEDIEDDVDLGKEESCEKALRGYEIGAVSQGQAEKICRKAAMEGAFGKKDLSGVQRKEESPSPTAEQR